MTNTLKTTVLLAALTALFILLGGMLGGEQGMAIAFLMAAVMNFASYWWSDKIVLWMYGAREIGEAGAPEFYHLVRRLAQQAGLPMPWVYIIPTETPNAFATGRNPKNSVVAVTSALMERLEQPEVEAVLAHELSHIKNRDVMVMTLASFFSTVAFFIMRFSMLAGQGSGRRDRSGQAMLLVYVASLLVWLISFFLIRALSRYRELAADRGSAILTGAPSQLAAALLKISSTMQRIPSRDLREVEGLNAFFIVPALSGASLMELFSTHPSLEKRLERLERMQREMEGR